MLEEFKKFILQGNLIEIAVGLILALKVKDVVDSLVADVITPIIAAAGGQPNFDSLVIDIGDGEIRYGAFLNTVLSLLIVGFVLFLIVKAYNKMRPAPAAPVVTKPCPFCKTDIPLEATRCPACTSQL